MIDGRGPSARPTRAVLAATMALTLGCGGASSPPSEPGDVATGGDTGGGGSEIDPTSGGAAEDDPRVSTSAGVEGGVVVLWPRVVGIPEEEPGILQAKLGEIAVAALPDAPVDTRPEPERACPRSGCLGVSVGALLAQAGEQCMVVVFVSEAGRSPAHLIPVLGGVTLRVPDVPFREPVESFVTLRDFGACGELGGALESHRAEIEAAIREAD